MSKENLYVKMEKLEAQICKCTRQGLKLCPAKSYVPNFIKIGSLVGA